MIKRVHHRIKQHYHARYHGVYAHAKQLFVFDLALLGLATVMLGAALYFFFIWKPGLMDYIDLQISLGYNRIESGQTVRLTVDYTNRSKYKLSGSVLALHLPKGFVVDRSATPTGTFSEQSAFTLGELLPGAKGQAGVAGRLWVTPRQEEKIYAILSYTNTNSGRLEQKISPYFLTVPNSVIKLNLTVATTTYAGQSLPFSLSLTNAGDADIASMGLLPAPAGVTFNLGGSSPFALKSGESKEFTGIFKAPTGGGVLNIPFNAFVSVNNHAINQLPIVKTIALLTPRVLVSASLPSSTLYAEPGAQIPLRISWRNSGQLPLKNASLIISPTQGVVDIRSTAALNHLTARGNDLVIDDASRTALTKINPGDGEDFEITLILHPNFVLSDENIKDLSLPVKFEAESEAAPGQIYSSEDSNKLSIPLSTELSLNASARYFTAEGDQLGRGPLPPRVGSATRYWIFAQIKNTVNPLSGGKLNIELSPGVGFTGKQSVSAGLPLKYNASQKQVSWEYGETLPPYSLTGFYFEVSAAPGIDAVGRPLTLINKINFTAADDRTNKVFSLSAGPITNELPADDEGASLGAEVVGR